MMKSKEFIHYMQSNNIDIAYIDESNALKILLDDSINIKDILILYDTVYYRSKNDDELTFFKIDDRNTNIKILDILQTHGISVIGHIFKIESNNNIIPLFNMGNYYYFDISSFFGSLLYVKNDEELFKLKCSALLTEKLLKNVFNQSINQGHNCRNIKSLFLEECGKLGIEETHVNVTQISTSKSYMPMYSIDCGISASGYYSDITRLFCYDYPDDFFCNAYAFLQDLQDCIVQTIREGMYVKDLYVALNRKYRNSSMFRNVRNGFGHGIGKQLHEGLSICSNQKWKFEDGLTFTLEPILVLNDVELRIENMYYLKSGNVGRINTLLTNDIIVLNEGKNTPKQRIEKDTYCVNPEIMMFQGTESNLIANLSFSSLSKGKNLYYCVNKSGFEVLQEFRFPTKTKKIKEIYPEITGYIDFLISEEILI